MRRRIPLWVKVTCIVVLFAAIVISTPQLGRFYRYYRRSHDLSLAEHFQIDVRLIDGVQVQHLDGFFDSRLSREDLPTDIKEFLDEHADEHGDLYLLSRVTPRLGTEENGPTVIELVIEIAEPEYLRGARFTIIPPGGEVQLPGEVCYSLVKIISARTIGRTFDATSPVEYKVVHIFVKGW